MRALLPVIAGVILGAVTGCASKSALPVPDLMRRTHGTGERWAALYVSPDVRRPAIALAGLDGKTTPIEVGTTLEEALVRAAGDAFSGVMTLSQPAYAGARTPAPMGQAIWPRAKNEKLPPPDLVVSVYAAEFVGHRIPGGACASCRDTMSLRLDLVFEMRSLDGALLSTGKVSGQAHDSFRATAGKPFAESTRRLVERAVGDVASELTLGLVASAPAP